MSKYEDATIIILQNEGIKLEREKTFNDLRGGRYRYDFYLPQLNILLEIDGIQHFKCIPHFFQTRSDFKKGQEHDRRKNAYALAKKIPLYRIPQWEFDKGNINSFKDLIDEKFLVKSKWHLDKIQVPEEYK